MKQRFLNGYNNARTRANLVATALMLSPAFAMASGGGSDFDGSEILAKIATYTAVAVGLLAAFALGRWTLRAMGLIGGKTN